MIQARRTSATPAWARFHEGRTLQVSGLRSCTCPNCGSVEIDSDLRCASCGSQLVWNVGSTELIVAGLNQACPKCRHVNPSDHRFCAKCGQTLAVECVVCGKEHPAGTLVCPATGVPHREIRAEAAAYLHLLAEAGEAEEHALPARQLADRRARLSERIANPPEASLSGSSETAGYSCLGAGVGFVIAIVFAYIRNRSIPSDWSSVDYMAITMGMALLLFGGSSLAAYLVGLQVERKGQQARAREAVRERDATLEEWKQALQAMGEPDYEAIARAEDRNASAARKLQELTARYGTRGVDVRAVVERVSRASGE